MDYDKMQRASFHMMEAFDSFRQAMELYKNDRGIPSEAPTYEDEEVRPMGSEEVLASIGREEGNDEWYDCPQPWPGRMYFSREDINPEDPRFYSGMEIGIPKPVAVANRYGQGFMIPSAIFARMFEGY